jgi:plastocyanin
VDRVRGTGTLTAPVYDPSLMRRLLPLLICLAALLAAPAVAGAATAHMTAGPSPVPGAQRLHFEYGPVHVAPGQNDIRIDNDDLTPPEEGYIVAFRPNLTLTDRARTVPRVDQIHLHHAVWLDQALRPLWAAGEEKTIVTAPAGYGWHYRPSDRWLLNHMIHNLTPTATDVYITYDLDFIPATSPAAAGMRDVTTLWMDVMGFKPYPVFNALMGRHGGDRRYTYPDESGQRGYALNRKVIDKDGVLVGTAGHLHPGGLYTDLDLTRDGHTVRLFRSKARYWEPAGAVSWDVAMTATPAGWRVGVKKGDVLSVHATYDTSRASWYESMGIMPVAFHAGGTGPDPFRTKVAVRGRITHGHLAENRNHGGQLTGLPDARTLLSAQIPPKGVAIRDFTYGRGDLGLRGRRGRPPTVRAGRTLRFVNRDGSANIQHSITSCRAPCNRATGIAYPLANGRARFDSGTLGYGPVGFTAAANRVTWRTPKRLKAGTYTYFCRIHPFMRGAFRVKPARG